MPWKVDRREFMTVMGAATAAGIGLPRALLSVVKPPRVSLFRWTTINPQLDVAIGAGGNSLVVKGPDGAALVDSKILGVGPSLLQQAGSIAEAPIQFLFNTHHHGDHTGGNHAFTDAECIAQANASARIIEGSRDAIRGVQDAERWVDSVAANWGIEMAEDDRAELLGFAAAAGELDPDSFGPDRTYERRLEHTGTGVELDWRHVGPGHTDNDAFLFIPQHNVLHAGDLLFVGTHPFLGASDGGNTVGWQRSLAAAIAMCDEETVVIPGHGAITDKSGLRAQSQYFDRLRELVISGMEVGTPKETIQEIEPDEFKDLGWKAILPALLGIIFDELE